MLTFANPNLKSESLVFFVQNNELNAHCFINEYFLACFLLSSKRSISIGMEQKNNLQRFETLRLNSPGIFSRSEIAQIYGANIEAPKELGRT